ncbi:MAG: hypothetical protein AB1918_15015 [Pseudomonadota bacterium]
MEFSQIIAAPPGTGPSSASAIPLDGEDYPVFCVEADKTFFTPKSAEAPAAVAGGPSPQMLPVGLTWEVVDSRDLENVWPPKTDESDPFGDLLVHVIATLEARGTSVIMTKAIAAELFDLLKLPQPDKAIPHSMDGRHRLQGKVSSKLGKLADDGRVLKNLDGNNRGIWSLPKSNQRAVSAA